uniref:Uncharacterized protein n=1 Tax=Paenarthrobacter aurescens TaxID=43663 RepID=Q6SKF5_PAEAU|nr:hypothetical protein [Paenarthrobacter aurescens]
MVKEDHVFGDTEGGESVPLGGEVLLVGRDPHVMLALWPCLTWWSACCKKLLFFKTLEWAWEEGVAIL